MQSAEFLSRLTLRVHLDSSDASGRGLSDCFGGNGRVELGSLDDVLVRNPVLKIAHVERHKILDSRFYGPQARTVF